MRTRLTLMVNGEEREVVVPVHKTLLEVLREDLNLTGTKHGCELGECGTCTALLEDNPTPTRDEVRYALAGNLCRCTGYSKILDAVELAALRLKGVQR